MSEREHLQQVEKVTGKTPTELLGPDFPVDASLVWAYFLEVHQGRSYGMSGPNPVSWSDLSAWCNLHGIVLSSWEVSTIKELDLLWISIAHED